MQVSVVIPVKDEERTIGRLLDSLANQTRKPDEIVVVDGGSSDRTVEIVRTYISRGYPIRLVCTDHAYPGQARNIGVRHARFDTIAFTDAGIRLDPRWLEKLCDPMEQDPSISVVYGTYEPVVKNLFQECLALVCVPARAWMKGGFIRGPSIASSLVRKEAWESVGGFPPYRASEDLIFMEALERLGFKIAYASEAVAYWELPSSWGAAFRRFLVYSYHNLAAGRGRYWHWGIARQYIAISPFVLLTMLHNPLWSTFLFCWMAARVAKQIWSKGHDLGIEKPARAARWLLVACIIALIDLATMLGVVLFCKDRLLGRTKSLYREPQILAQYDAALRLH